LDQQHVPVSLLKTSVALASLRQTRHHLFLIVFELSRLRGTAMIGSVALFLYSLPVLRNVYVWR
jgi:hypothetical protein